MAARSGDLKNETDSDRPTFLTQDETAVDTSLDVDIDADVERTDNELTRRRRRLPSRGVVAVI